MRNKKSTERDTWRGACHLIYDGRCKLSDLRRPGAGVSLATASLRFATMMDRFNSNYLNIVFVFSRPPCTPICGHLTSCRVLVLLQFSCVC